MLVIGTQFRQNSRSTLLHGLARSREKKANHMGHNRETYKGGSRARMPGDSMIHSFGVSSDPDIFERNLSENDEFIVIGSDGLFEFLSNQDVVTIVGDHVGDAKAACEELIATSRSRWARVISK